MRPLNDEEWDNYKDVVKCTWLLCAGGMGLAGHGHCSFAGEWDNPECPDFITEDDYLKRWRDEFDNEGQGMGNAIAGKQA